MAAISVPEERYIELVSKANAYDEMIASRRRGAEKANAVSAEVRSARAKKAVQARIEKYHQNTKQH